MARAYLTGAGRPVAKKCFVANQKMSNEPNFMDAKTNVTSGLTMPYETALLRSTEKTNPISSTLPNAGCIAKDARRRTKKCQTNPIFRRAKINITSALTKDYENEQPTDPAKTKPILPAVSVAGLPLKK
jgi:hypothetical protein